MIQLYADKNRLTIRQSETVTSGSVNTVECRFTFSPHWEGLEKTAVFRAGERTAAVLLDESGRCTVPWEVLEKPGRTLSAGVYGRDPEGGLTLPTVWADLRTILEGASPGEMARPPTPDLWEQELAKKGDSLSYDGLNLTLLSGERPLSSVPVAGGGGTPGETGGLPPGCIVIWSGGADRVPAGWALCDGEEGRPDLRDRFVLGAGTVHPVGETGGEEDHVLTEDEMPEHVHNAGTLLSSSIGGGWYAFAASTATSAKKFFQQSSSQKGASQPHNNMPPYYVMCYIIKL